MRLNLWLSDRADGRKYIEKVLRSWLQPALDDLDDGARLRPETAAALFGVKVRTASRLLRSPQWAEVFAMIPAADDRPPHTRESDCERLAKSQHFELAWCEREFEEWLARSQAGLVPTPAECDDVDTCVQLVTRVDAMSRVAIAMAWLLDSHGSIDAPMTRKHLVALERFMTRFSCHAEHLTLAEELIWATGRTFARRVLAPGRLGLEQLGQLEALPQPLRQARQSASWFAELYGSLEWRAVELATESSPSESAHPEILETLSRLRLDMTRRHLPLDDPSDHARLECSRWSMEEASRFTIPSARATAVSFSILARQPLMAAAAAPQGRKSVWLRWLPHHAAADRSADCHLYEGESHAVVTFYDDAGGHDSGVNGQPVSWLGMTVKATEHEALFDLGQLRDAPPSVILERMKRMPVLSVAGSEWQLKEFRPSGS
jgi:hypothetical protein